MTTPIVSLAGRRALVTGAAAGIGRAIATALDRAGAIVWVTDIDAAGAAQVAASLSQGGGHDRIDVTRAADVARGFAAAVDALGGIDIVCANAGISTMNRVVDLTEDDWDSNMAVNAKGVFLVDREAVRHFQTRAIKGVIVNTASLAAKVGAPLLAHYSASKFAVVGFTQALAREVAHAGIRANCVCPGFIETPMIQGYFADQPDPEAARTFATGLHPLGRLGAPHDIADAFVYLASDEAAWVTGTALTVDGGLTSGIWGG